MKQHSLIKPHRYFPVKTITVLTIIVSIATIMSFTVETKQAFKDNDSNPRHFIKDSAESVKAFMEVYKVLMSPRCMNCHPSGDIPLQGDDSKLHTMSPKRGKDGKGLYAMKCTNCHQPENTQGIHMPPGSPDWHLPPANMKMVFQGRTPNQLAKQLVDRKRNGNKSMAQLLAHADDKLVLVGWNPGEGRSVPPMSHAEFKKAWIAWINNGAYAPKP
jgi:hypothetical protein